MLDRRAVLRVGGAGLLGGLTYPQLLAATNKAKPKAAAKTVIFLHQWGGPGQHETFDMKPDAPEKVRGWYKPASTVIPGLQICEKLPQIAKMVDRLSIIRCMAHTTKMNNHNSAGYYSLTGMAPPTDDQRLRDSVDLFPAYGSIVSKLAPAKTGTASFVAYPHVISDGSITPGQHASFLGKTHNPLFFSDDPNKADFKLPELSLPENVSPERLANRTEIMKLIDSQTELLDQSALAKGMDESFQKAVSMLTSPKFRAAFDLTQESAKTRDRYGRTTYGQGCLLARRLVEAGAKFINVYFSQQIGGKGHGWDYHGFNGENVVGRLEELLPMTDQTLPALILDLEERGLLDSTLVVWVGEFGRTPKISGNGGRDHWPMCYNAVLAGGGTKRGHVYGASDKNGAYPTLGQAGPEDLAATMFEALGIPHEAEIRDALGRPLPISRGKPIADVLA
ncbi:MAG: DUF1501 domain-containing protein [Fimbriiglobus sp.]